MREILTYWAELALYPGALSEEAVPLIAALVALMNADARYAIDLLARSAEVCIEDPGIDLHKIF